jgi:hypothetical protein
MNFLGASSCYRCPEGHYCTSGSTADICSAGYYCPEGTGFDIQPCPVGTFGERTRLVTIDQCSKCTSGHYCQFSGKPKVTGPCDGGKILFIEVDACLCIVFTTPKYSTSRLLSLYLI